MRPNGLKWERKLREIYFKFKRMSYLTDNSVQFRKYILLCNNEYRVAILLKAMQFTAITLWYEGHCVFHFCCHSLGRHILTLKRPPGVRFDPSLCFFPITFLMYLTMTPTFVTLSLQVSSRSA